LHFSQLLIKIFVDYFFYPFIVAAIEISISLVQLIFINNKILEETSMKKLLIVVILVLLAVPAFTAENPAVKGNIAVTLPLFSYWTGMGDLDKSSCFSFLAMGYEPEVQYFVMDSLAVGGKVGYMSEEDINGGKTKTTSFGPLANYYLTMIKAPVLPYAGAGLLYEQVKRGEEKIKQTELRVQGGAVYMLGKYLSAYGEVFISPYVKYSDGSSLSGQKLGFAAGVKAFF
jgi:hypothetical protein